jgi:hypothetical protein
MLRAIEREEMTVQEALNNTLEGLEIGAPVSHGPLYLFPLKGEPSKEEDLALLDEALGEGTLRVEELDEEGSVPELRVVNRGTRPVLVLEGDELVGAKQNRAVNSSVLVASESELIIPVSCVERGRWSRRPRAFSSGAGSPHPSLRRIKARSVHDSLRRNRGHASDQGAVWEEVDRVAALHDAPSPTSALQDTRERLFRVVLVAPPPVGVLTELALMFAGAEEKSRGFSRQYRRVGQKYGCVLLDAGEVVSASERDGIHLEAGEHRKLGEAMAASVKGSLGL